VQIAPGLPKLPHREIEVVNIARQTGGVDGTGGSTADDPERVGSASWKNPRDGAQYANLIRRSRPSSTHDQRDARPLHVNRVRHYMSGEIALQPTYAGKALSRGLPPLTHDLPVSIGYAGLSGAYCYVTPIARPQVVDVLIRTLPWGRCGEQLRFH
jgi:hypothetical protein